MTWNRTIETLRLSLCLLIGWGSLLTAQETNTPTVTVSNATTRLTLAQSQDIARRQNRELRTIQNNFMSALAGRRIADSEVFAPTLDLSQRFSDSDDAGEARAEINYLAPLGIEITPFISERYNGPSDSPEFSTLGVTLNRRLFSTAERWRLRQPLTRAERALLQAQNTLQQQTREIDFNVMRTFLALQRVDNRLRVRQARVTDAMEFYNTVTNSVALGLSPSNDIVNARINLNQAEADILIEKANLQDRTEALLNLLGYDVTNRLDIVPYDVSATTSNSIDLSADTANLLKRHESLLNEHLDIDQARIDLKIQKDLLRPQFGIALSGEHRSEGLDPFNDRVDASDPYTLQLTYSTPLDGKKADKARLEQLELAMENMIAALKGSENILVIQLRSTYRTIERLKIQVDLSRQRLAAERQRLVATLVRYEDGNVDNLEVTRAKQAVDDAEINLIDTTIDLVLAEEEYHSLLPPVGVVQTRLSKP